MRNIIVLLVLLVSTAAFAQKKDRRAKLDIRGMIKEISVAPDERIWLTTNVGSTYFSNHIDSNWHQGKLLPGNEDKPVWRHSRAERLSFFNKDTAIMTGDIRSKEMSYKKSGYYVTQDGGATWELKDFGRSSLIYDVFVGSDGCAWMGGSSGAIHFTNDYGQSWAKLRSRHKASNGLHSIFMLNEAEGISGALKNNIYITSNNWKSSKRIKSPFDHKMYENGSGNSDNPIKKIILWGDYIVVNQNNFIYYSQKKEIYWQRFDQHLIDFELDKATQMLYAVTDDLRVLSFTSPVEYQMLTEQKLSSRPMDVKAVNGSLYMVNYGYKVFKASPSGIVESIPYTIDTKIPEPKIVKRFHGLSWGVTGNQIFLAEKGDQDWYREHVTTFGIADFRLLNDSLAILWDGKGGNYTYSLKSSTTQAYEPKQPLAHFLEAPIQSVTIRSQSRGCSYRDLNEVVYERIGDSTLVVKGAYESSYSAQKTSRFKNDLSVTQLSQLLEQVDEAPSRVPTLQEFEITEEDKENYLALVNSRSESIYWFKERQGYYHNILNSLDSFENESLQKMLSRRESVWSTTSNWFTIQMINENQDTLTISRQFYVSSLPWNLPWVFEYNGQYFNCYHIGFSKFIDQATPEDFMGKKVFDNKYLLMEIANHIYSRR